MILNMPDENKDPELSNDDLDSEGTVNPNEHSTLGKFGVDTPDSQIKRRTGNPSADGGGDNDNRDGNAGSRIEPSSDKRSQQRLAEEADRVFGDKANIFTNKEILQISYVPDSERIVGRDDYIKTVASNLRPATEGKDPENMIITGRTGTGKSLVSKYATRLTKWKADQDDASVGTAYIDCKSAKTETKLAQTIGSVLNDEEKTGVTFPDTGLSPDNYYHRLWKVLDTLYDTALIILDEIDKQRNYDNVLSALSRAGEDEHTDTTIGLILITNKSRWVDDLEQRTNSGFQFDKIVFPPYDKDGLTEIMNHRRDAFYDDVLDDGVIPIAAKYAAREDGDARRALDILRNAGKLAERQNDDTVTVTHVHDAADHAEREEVSELIGDEPKQSLATLLALATLTKQTEDSDFNIPQVYDTYAAVTDTTPELDTLSERRMRDILQDLDFYEIVGIQKQNGGFQRGQVTTIRLIYDVDAVIDVVTTTHTPFAEAHETVSQSILDYL